MSNRIPRTSAGNAHQSPNMFLAPAFGMWNPFFTGALSGNAQAHEGFGTIADEWQDFVGRRLKEDFALIQRLTRSSTPDQIVAAYADFWQKAAEDFGREITTMSKLMTGATTKAAQSSTTASSTTVLPSREAA
jgi:hypothetical protein